MAFLEIENLTKNFSGLWAIDRLDWKVEPGEIAGLIGPNGAGKTTLFNMINGFLRPSEGRIEFKGKSLIGLRTDQIARMGISTVFQRSLLFRGNTVFQNVLVGCYGEQRTGFWQALFNTASYRREEEVTRQRALQTLEFIGLTKWKDSLAETLPIGAQRLLAVGQALMTKPQLLLLDEPFTGLNDEEMLKLVDEIREIRNQGITIILIEHHMKWVMLLCERIMVLNYGKKIADGTPEVIANNSKVIEAYLGSEANAT